MTNNQAAQMFSELADLLDLAGELPFKSASYRKVADSLRNLDTPFEKIVETGEYDKIPGVGKAIREKLAAMAYTDELPALVKWRKHEIAVFYPWLNTIELKPRPLGILIRKLGAVDFHDLIVKLKGQDIKKLTGQTKATAKIILDNK